MRFGSMVIAISCAFLAAVPEQAAAETAAQRTAADEVRSAILMLESGPLHVRFRISLEGMSLSEARDRYIDRLIDSLDTDGDGRLTREEADRTPLLRKPRREGARRFLESLEVRQTVEPQDIRQTVVRVGGQTVVYRQDASSAETDLEVFRALDVDGNGVLDQTEMAQAAERIEQRDRDRDGCVSFREFLPDANDEPEPPVVLSRGGSPDESRPTPTFSDSLRDTRDPLLPRRLIEQYDENRDARLSPEELSWSRERLDVLDRSGDGHLDRRELKRIDELPADVEIAVELTDSGAERARLQVSATVEVEPSPRQNFARIELAGADLTVSVRHIDPVTAAVDNALREFNRLDVDGNGYLTEEETAERIRFQRGLFEIIDADGDGKIFGDEMERYVSVRGKPAALSCRVNLYDMGSGFFQALDRDGDGRISVRERRNIESSLRQMRRDARSGLTPEEARRHFHVELVRGSFRLFGRADQMVARTPRFETFVPVGPVWFQRMDRNTDGDLTWMEFLGPRDVFHRLDRDGDGLMDPQEAEYAKKE